MPKVSMTARWVVGVTPPLRGAAPCQRQDVMLLLDAIVAQLGASIMSNRTRALLSKMFNWAFSRDLLEHNPLHTCASTGEKAPP